MSIDGIMADEAMRVWRSFGFGVGIYTFCWRSRAHRGLDFLHMQGMEGGS